MERMSPDRYVIGRGFVMWRGGFSGGKGWMLNNFSF